MSALSRRRATLVGVSGLSLAVAGAIAPGAFAADTIDGDVKVSNTETVQVLMNADGSIDSQRIYEQVVLTGNGKVDISNPVSEKGLRNLDGFGGFDVRDGQSRIKTSVDGTKKFRSVSDFTGKLPLKFDITYTLDGKKISPSDVVGKSGALEVRYVVTNLTGTPQEVSFQDGAGLTKSSTEDVVIPMVGSLTTVLPSSFTKVASAEANAAGDGRGGTQLSFTMTLIPPIGNATAEFGYKAQVKDAVIPKASVSALPVNPLESPSFKGGAASYAGGAETGQDLTAGATEIDANVLKLRDGASDLVAGILQLRDGANKLSTGLTNDAAPGAKKLADGANKLDAGAKQLAGGSGDLSAGAGKLKSGASDLSDGTGKLSAGAKKLNTGAGDLSNGLSDLQNGLKGKGTAADPGIVAGLAQISAGLSQLDGKLEKDLKQAIVPLINGLLIPKIDESINDIQKTGNPADPTTWGALQVLQAIADITSGVNGTLAPGDPRKDSLKDAKDLADGLRAKLDANVGAANPDPTKGTGLKGLKGGLQAISGGISAGVGTPTDPPKADGSPSSFRSALKALKDGTDKIKGGAESAVGGVDKLSTGAGQLKAGTGDLSKGAGDLDAGAGQLKAGTGDLKAGADKLNAGAGTLKGGTGQLSIGAAALAEGLGTASAGSAEIAAGLEKAAGSAPALPEGADRLSKEGTSQLIEAGNATASDYGLKYAMIEAGAARAGSAQPYGSPEGATALAAFKFEISGESGADSANLKRGVAAIVLLAAAGALATVRRRGTI